MILSEWKLHYTDFEKARIQFWSEQVDMSFSELQMKLTGGIGHSCFKQTVISSRNGVSKVGNG